MEIEDEIEDLKSTIKALRRHLAEDNCYIDALEDAINEAKIAFHAGASASDMYNALTRTEIKTKS
jgi:predicted RNase H-like nuclease (RuvC/YqgF family)